MLSSPSAARPRIHVIYEYGVDYRPHASSFVRLLRPLSHPHTAAWAHFSYGRDLIPPGTDLVIVDRLWRPDIDQQMAHNLLDQIHNAGAKFIFCLDDNLLDLPLVRLDWPRPEHLEILRSWLHQADGVMVSTAYLAERLKTFNPRIFTIPNALDERLLIPRPVLPEAQTNKPLVIGYMGTQTHDDDLRLILPAIRAVNERRAGQIMLEIIGVTTNPETLESMRGLPVRWISPDPRESEYPLFMLWFTSQVHWDIALAPLQDTIFTRAKSDIKYLDYAAISAPGIFSNVPAYSSSIHHGQNGLLVENTPEAWEAAIEALITRPDYRQQIASQAVTDLHRNRIINCCAINWETALKSFL